MKYRLPFLLLVLLVVSNACLSAPAIGSGLNPGSVQGGWVTQPQSNPVNLAVTLDTGQTATASISPNGGSLSVTSAGGDRYRLDIPAKALVTDTVISMTVVKSLSGMPFKSSGSLAVQLEPSGLQLYDFAVLTITPAQPIPIDHQIFFGYEGSGQNLFLATPVVDSKEIKLKILHFSGYGVDKGLLADIEPVRQRLGGAEEARLQSLAAEMLAIERQKALMGIEDDTFSADFAALTQLYYDRVIKVRLDAAGQSCAAGRLAFQTVLGWERQRQLMGIETGPSVSGFSDPFQKVALVCLKEEYELCRDNHIIHRMIPVWLGLERQMQLMGIEAPQLSDQAKAYTEKCLRFDLVFESQAALKSSGSGYESDVSSTVHLRFNGDFEAGINGKAPLYNSYFDMNIKNCSTTSTRGGGEFNSIQMVYDVGNKGPDDKLGYVKDIWLTYFPGMTSEQFSVKCGKASYTSPRMPMWTPIFIVLHNSERKPASDGSQPVAPALPDLLNPGSSNYQLPSDAGTNAFIAKGWTVPAGELFATKEWNINDPALKSIEVGSFKLYHRPG